MSQNNSLLATLINAGLIQNTSSDISDIQPQTLQAPWYVKTLLAISGWLGAAFFLAFFALFLFLSENTDEPAFVGFVGILLVTLAYFIMRAPKNEFFEHLGLALSLAGQALVVFSLVGDSLFNGYDDYINWLWVGVFHTALAVLMPSFVHRVFSSAFATISFNVAFITIGASEMVSSVALMIFVVLYTNEFKRTTSYKKFSGAIYGLIIYWLIVHCITSVDTMIFSFSYRYDHEPLFTLPYEVSQGLFIFAIMFCIWAMMHSVKKAESEIDENTLTTGTAISTTKITLIALGVCLAVCLLTLHASGIPAALIIIVLGFSRSNRVMMGMGILALLSYCSVYYYTMEQTLLYKSAIFFAVGFVMLTIRFAIVRFWPESKSTTESKADIEGANIESIKEI